MSAAGTSGPGRAATARCRAPSRRPRTGSKIAAITPVTASSGWKQDLPVGLAPDQPDRQAAAQLAAGGLVPDPAVQPGPQDVQLGFGHRALHAQHQPVVEQAPDGRRRRRRRSGCRSSRPGPAADTSRRCCGPAGRPPAPARSRPGRGPTWAASSANPARCPVTDPETPRSSSITRTALRGQPSCRRPRDQVVLAGGGLAVALDLGQGGLADIDDARLATGARR